MIVTSEFFETDRSRRVCVVGDITTEKFLPLTPSCDMIWHPADNGPQDQSPKKEHKKDFHEDSLAQLFYYCNSHERR